MKKQFLIITLLASIVTVQAACAAEKPVIDLAVKGESDQRPAAAAELVEELQAMTLESDSSDAVVTALAREELYGVPHYSDLSGVRGDQRATLKAVLKDGVQGVRAMVKDGSSDLLLVLQSSAWCPVHGILPDHGHQEHHFQMTLPAARINPKYFKSRKAFTQWLETAPRHITDEQKDALRAVLKFFNFDKEVAEHLATLYSVNADCKEISDRCAQAAASHK